MRRGSYGVPEQTCLSQFRHPAASMPRRLKAPRAGLAMQLRNLNKQS